MKAINFIIVFTCTYLTVCTAKCNINKTTFSCSNTTVGEIKKQRNNLDKVIEVYISGSILGDLPNNFLVLPRALKVSVNDSEINRFKDTTFESLPQLKQLELTSCRIKNLPSDGFPLQRLVSLDLSGNLLKNLSLADTFFGLTALTDLKLQNNQIENIELGVFDEVEQLQRLDLSYNKLSNLKVGIFDELKLLKQLYLAGNHLTILPLGIFDENRKLNSLDLAKNQFENIPLGTFDNYTIEQLNLSANALTTIKDGLFDELYSLKVLKLSKNQIKHIKVGTFSSNPGLRYLDFSKNKLEVLDEGLFTGLINVESLFLWHNRLMWIEPNVLEPMRKLKRLELSSNPWICPCLKLLIEKIDQWDIEYSKGYFTDGKRPNCIITDKDICEYRRVSTTNYDKIIEEYS